MRYRLRTLLIVLALGPVVLWLAYYAIQLALNFLRDGGVPDRSAPFR